MGSVSEKRFKPREGVKTMTGDAGKSYWNMTDNLQFTFLR